MQIAHIILIILTGIQLSVICLSTFKLHQYRQTYPVKQLSPRVTMLVGWMLFATCATLTCAELFATRPNHFNTLCRFYVYFRQAAIIGFYMRCLRICLAYHRCIFGDTAERLLLNLFSSETKIILTTLVISLLLPIVQIIEHDGMNQAYVAEFFHFFSVPAKRESWSYVVWILDNGLFFIVTILSIRIDKRLNFIRSLIIVYVLYHAETWYRLIMVRLCDKDIEITLEKYFYIIPFLINMFALVVLVWHVRKPNEYETRLPIDIIITNHFMLMNDDEGYLILFQFVRSYSQKYQNQEIGGQYANKYFEIYSQLVGVQKQIRKQIVGNEIQQQEAIQKMEGQIVKKFIIKWIIPNFDTLPILQSTTRKLFINDRVTEDSIKRDITQLDLASLKSKLDKIVRFMYNLWYKTVSKRQFQKELKRNNDVVSKMAKLDISLV